MAVTIYTCPNEHHETWRSLWEGDRCPLCGGELESEDYVPVTWLEEREGMRQLATMVLSSVLTDVTHELALGMDRLRDLVAAVDHVLAPDGDGWAGTVADVSYLAERLTELEHARDQLDEVVGRRRDLAQFAEDEGYGDDPMPSDHVQPEPDDA